MTRTSGLRDRFIHSFIIVIVVVWFSLLFDREALFVYNILVYLSLSFFVCTGFYKFLGHCFRFVGLLLLCIPNTRRSGVLGLIDIYTFLGQSFNSATTTSKREERGWNSTLEVHCVAGWLVLQSWNEERHERIRLLEGEPRESEEGKQWISRRCGMRSVCFPSRLFSVFLCLQCSVFFLLLVALFTSFAPFFLFVYVPPPSALRLPPCPLGLCSSPHHAFLANRIKSPRHSILLDATASVFSPETKTKPSYSSIVSPP